MFHFFVLLSLLAHLCSAQSVSASVPISAPGTSTSTARTEVQTHTITVGKVVETIVAASPKDVKEADGA